MLLRIREIEYYICTVFLFSSQSLAIEKLHSCDDAFRKQLEKQKEVYERELDRLTGEKEEVINQSNRKVGIDIGTWGEWYRSAMTWKLRGHPWLSTFSEAYKPYAGEKGEGVTGAVNYVKLILFWAPGLIAIFLITFANLKNFLANPLREFAMLLKAS